MAGPGVGGGEVGPRGDRPGAETVRRVAGRFLGTVSAVRPFGGGHINDTFLASGPAGDLVVQRLNVDVFPDPEAVTANILAVFRHGRGRLVPEPVATPGGDWLVWDGPSPWRAWRRAPGAPLAPARATPAALHGAGRLLGQFHGLVAGLDPAGLTETLPRFHDPGRRLADLRAVIAADPCGRVATATDAVEAALAAEPLVAVAADLAAGVPRRVAHFDAKLDNILFAGGEPVVLVDLDTVMPGAWFWDVGDLVRSGATTAAEDEGDLDRIVVAPPRYEAILEGYRAALIEAGVAEGSELEAAELAGAVVTYEQGLRFLTDWIAGDVYYRVHRPGHNLDRARAQFRLLAGLPCSASR